MDGRILVGGHGPIRLEASEMVETHDIDPTERVAEALDPPGVAGALKDVPAIERIAPQLAGRAEVIRRDAGDGGGMAIGVEIEQVRVRPGIGAVESDKDGDVADDGEATAVGVGVQR